MLFLCENFLRYNIGAFFVGKLPRCPRRQSKRKSVKVFYPCNFVVSSYSKALRIPLRQNMSAGHRFAVSKINALSRQGRATCLCFFVRKFFAVQYRCIFCRETATLSTTSVKAKIRESFLPVQFCGKFVLKSVAHSVATKYVGRS